MVIGVVSLGALAFLVLSNKLLPAQRAERDAVRSAADGTAGEAA